MAFGDKSKQWREAHAVPEQKDPMPTDPPNDRLLEILDKLAEKSAAAGLTPEQLQQVLESVAASSAEGMRRSLKPENAEHPHISAFFTEVDRQKYGTWTQKPKLARPTYFCGVKEDEERLTPVEIEGYNRLTADAEARHGRWKAKVRKNGQAEELHVQVPCDSLEDRMDLRPLTLILHELAGGRSTEDLGDLLRQIQHLQQVAVKHGASVHELEATYLES